MFGYKKSKSNNFGIDPALLHIAKDWVRFIIFFYQGLYGFKQKTILWSITKSKWIHGPRLPYMTGIEESCATLVNRSVVMIIGITRLNGKYHKKKMYPYNFIWSYILSEQHCQVSIIHKATISIWFLKVWILPN